MGNTPSTSPENIEVTSIQKIPGLSQQREKWLEDQGYDNYETFVDLIKSPLLLQQEKDVTISILNNSSERSLKAYFRRGFTLVDQDAIQDFITYPKFQEIQQNLQVTKSEEAVIQSEEAVIQSEEAVIQSIDKIKGSTTQSIQEISEFLPNLQSHNFDAEFQGYLTQLEGFRGGLNEIFKIEANILILRNTKITEGNEDDILALLSNKESELKAQIEEFGKEYEEFLQSLTTYLSTGTNAQEIFAQLKDDPESYNALYNFLQSNAKSNPSLTQVLRTIPPTPQEFEKSLTRAQNAKNRFESSPGSYFFSKDQHPEIKGASMIATIDGDIKKQVDWSDVPPGTYFLGENGYRIKLNYNQPEQLQARSEHTKAQIESEKTKQAIKERYRENFRQYTYQDSKLQTLKNDIQKIEFQLQDQQNDENNDISIGQEELKNLQTEYELTEQKLKQIEQERDKIMSEAISVDFDLKMSERALTDALARSHFDTSPQGQESKAQATLSFLRDTGISKVIPFGSFEQLIRQINTNLAYHELEEPINIQDGLTLKEELGLIKIFNKALNQLHWNVTTEKPHKIQKLNGDTNIQNEAQQLDGNLNGEITPEKLLAGLQDTPLFNEGQFSLIEFEKLLKSQTSSQSPEGEKRGEREK